MYGIIFIIIGALFAFMNGDDSGVIAILKIIGYGSLILGVLFVVAYAPWLIILVVVGVIIFAVCQSSTNNSANNNTQNNNTPSNSASAYHTQVIEDKNLTGFKAELQQNTKTPKQVEDEQFSKDREQIVQNARWCYDNIKKELLNKAKSGKYVINNGRRTVQIDHHEKYMFDNFIIAKHKNVYINKSLFKPDGEFADEITCDIQDRRKYNVFMSEINKLAKEDDIQIAPMIVYDKGNIERYTFPFTIQGFCLFPSSFKFILRCTVIY